jgi:hypothetical protein
MTGRGGRAGSKAQMVPPIDATSIQLSVLVLSPCDLLPVHISVIHLDSLS